METGFLNPIHDEEHFSSSFYNQGNEIDDSAHMLFGELIVPEIVDVDYEHLWQSDDDVGAPNESREPKTRKEDFQRMLFEWQNQLTYMQEPEAIKQIVPVAEKTTQEFSDMFADRSTTSITPTALCIDELFPLEPDKETYYNESSCEERSEEFSLSADEMVEAVEVKPGEGASSEVLKPDQIKSEKEDINLDVEVNNEEIPLLLAGDLTSLLEQFEATENVSTVQPSSVSLSPPRPTNQTIRDALPAEVINRIKATRENHKKIISVIPAIPNKRSGRAATRMQDAGAALSRSKLLKLVTGGSSGESVQLDHDYCTSGGDTTSNSSRSYYMSDSSEYPSQSSTPDASYSRLPEYFTPFSSQKSKDKIVLADSGSRKDSGLESGENSDEDLQPINRVKKGKVVLKSLAGLKSINVVTESGVVIGSAPVVRNKVPMVSVLKKNNVKLEKDDVNETSNATADVSEGPQLIASSTQVDSVDTHDAVKKKKKLNLEEYRVRRVERDRIRSQESSRASSPVQCGVPSTQPDPTMPSQECLPKEKPVMLSVEVQTQICDFIDLTSSKSHKEQEKSRPDHKQKRNDLKQKSYRSRHASSSSSSSVDSDHHRSHRRKKRSRSNKHRRSSVSRMWSRSPSRSSSRSHSSSRSRSRSRDKRQNWRSRSPRRNSNRYRDSKGFHNRDSHDRAWQRSRSPVRRMRNPEFGIQEKVRQVEERRVIYVGRIDEGTSKVDLRKRFQQFGPIVDISVHFRERGDNYGFVTFAYKADAYKAVEHGNDDPKQPRYDLCFGGRRAFCKQRYADLDGIATVVHSQYGSPVVQQQKQPPPQQQRSNESFDLLLHEVKAQLRKRSSV